MEISHTGVFISAGFLGEGTTKSNDMSFNIHMYVYPCADT